jgi:hypothetical protein
VSGLAPGRAGAVLVMALAASTAWAAGGHHAVDDAAVMEPGNCKLESWLSGAGGGERLLHAGGGCRVGPFELNAAGEYARAEGASQTGTGLQAKWAMALAPGFSAGLSLAAGWQAHVQPRYQGSTLSTLFTWEARDDVALHLNLGRDFLHQAADQNRWGMAAEWAPRQNWSLVAERYRAEGTHFARAGVRWALREGWSVDLSRAQRLRGPAASSWTLGAGWQFPRS